MTEDKTHSPETAELRATIEAVLSSPSKKKLVIAGPQVPARRRSSN